HTLSRPAWHRDPQAEGWSARSRPHSVIWNGADSAVFNAAGGAELEPGGPMRLVTHHWSANPMKGFGVCREVDRLIAAGDLAGVELWVIGRWPEGYEWQAARTFAPATGPDLAALLRQC